jgi:hypothetical protein
MLFSSERLTSRRRAWKMNGRPWEWLKSKFSIELEPMYTLLAKCGELKIAGAIQLQTSGRLATTALHPGVGVK